jgi:multidrug efflux pump subunit AcrB
MAETIYTNIIDPEVIEASVGNSWLNSMKFMRYAPQIFARDTRPISEGTLISQVRNTIFQGSQGQAVAADGTISSVGRVQTKASHPVLWRYGSVKEADVMAEIMPTMASGTLNAQYAEAAREAGAHYLEDSIIAAIEGTGSAITANQVGSGATVTLDLLADGLVPVVAPCEVLLIEI